MKKANGINYVNIKEVEVESKFIPNPDAFERKFVKAETEEKLYMIAGVVFYFIGLTRKDKKLTKLGRKFLGKHKTLIG
jgi:hypothetical protein